MNKMTERRRPLPKMRVLGAGFGAVLIGAAGCGTAQVGATSATPTAHVQTPSPAVSLPPETSDPVQEPPLGPVPEITSNRRVPMPLDPYKVSMADIKKIDMARDAGAAACMRGLGFTRFTSDTIRSWSPADYREDGAFPYRDPDKVEASGYPRPAPAGVRPRKSTHTPTEKEMAIYNGKSSQRTVNGKTIPQGGCVKEADRKIYGGKPKLPVDARALSADAEMNTIRDSRVRAATAQWSACMKGKGMAYGSPMAARGDARWVERAADQAAGAAEKKVAHADALCQSKVNLPGIYVAVKAAYEKRLLGANKAKLAQAKPIVEMWVRNANSINSANAD